MVFDSLGSSLKSALRKFAGAARVDEVTVNELVKDIQRALLQADVNVKLVMKLSSRIKERSLKEEPKPGVNPREHIINIVYQELIAILGKSSEIKLQPQKILLVGLQGSGKTTTVAKLARYYQRKGLKAGVICADTFRPGAYEQLKQLCEKIGVQFYGDRDGRDAVAIALNGLKALENMDVKIIDTCGRHALESDLIKEMVEIQRAINAEQKYLVLDAAIGQQAASQARAFNEAIGITGIIITKLDGTAKGGGALSACSEINVPIVFIGAGEHLDDLEHFESDRFISRLLGMGDFKTLIEKAREARIEEEIDLEAIVRGKFTLKDVYKQLEAVSKMGPLKQVLSMLPLGMDISEEQFEITKEKLKRFKIIMDSMTEKEMLDPRIMDSSRIKRVARGSGTRPEDVKELLKYHRTMQQAFKSLKGGKFPIHKLLKRYKL
ncbi:MAG: signal recognition particle protein Srp54 [Methanocellales archaeon]